ncbi:MAG: PKD domain-containing protein, partial [Bacteroidota bacterium]
MKRTYIQMTKAGIMALALVFVIFTSCTEKEPVIPSYTVAFSFSPTNPEAGDAVTFTNATQGGGSEYAWDFGDGGTSAEENPTHTFTAAGTYTVTLMVDNYPELTASKDVVVGDPAAVISYNPATVEAGTAITFSATVYNPDSETVTYAWDFGANATVDDATAASPVAIFTAPGDVTVTLTATVGSATQVGSTTVSVQSQLAKTLIFTSMDANAQATSGSLFYKKLFDGFEEDSVNMNVPTNAHPLTLRVRSNRVYVFDPGDGITYTTDPAAVDG